MPVNENGRETIQAYPLQWPAGWRRIPAERRKRADFHRREAVYRQDTANPGRSVKAYDKKVSLNVADSLGRILAEMSAMGIPRQGVVISTNIPTRLNGLPYSNARVPDDPGAAVYWKHGKTTRCMAVDRYDRVADNLAAIAATLEAMRAIERHGGAAILDRAFVGFKQLMEPEQWWQVLGLKTQDATREQIQEAYIAKARENHPDIPGGDVTAMARINAARDRGLEETGVRA